MEVTEITDTGADVVFLFSQKQNVANTAWQKLYLFPMYISQFPNLPEIFRHCQINDQVEARGDVLYWNPQSTLKTLAC